MCIYRTQLRFGRYCKTLPSLRSGNILCYSTLLRLVIYYYRSAFGQYGGGYMDLYIYSNQHGEGLGSFFGKLARTTIPILTKAIKASSRIASPHIKRAASDIVSAGAKTALQRLSNKTVHKAHSRKRKWRNL